MGSKRVNLLNTEWTRYTSSQSLRNLLKVQRYFHTILRHTASLSFHCWDLGPFAAVLQYQHPDASLLRPQNTKKLYGAERMCSWGKFWIKDTKGPKTQLPLLKSLEQKSRGSEAKAGSCAWPLHTIPPKGWANHPSSPTPGHTPTLIPYKERAHPHPHSTQKRAREPVDCSPLPLLQQGPQ